MSDKIRLTESIQIAHERLDALEKRADHAEERRKELCADGEARDKDIKALEERVNCIAENLQELITAPGPLHARVKALEEQIHGMKITDAALEKGIDAIAKRKAKAPAPPPSAKDKFERPCFLVHNQPAKVCPGPCRQHFGPDHPAKWEDCAYGARYYLLGEYRGEPAAPKTEGTCGDCPFWGESGGCSGNCFAFNSSHAECLARTRWREAEERVKQADIGWRQLVAEENAKRQMEQARAEKAEAKATQYEQDWYSAKSEFGDAMAKMRTRLREAEARVKELEDISHGTKATAEESCEIQEKLCDSCMRRFRADERERVAQHFEDYPNWTKSFPASKDVVKVIRAMPDRGKPK